jgi:hypothetical protein
MTNMLEKPRSKSLHRLRRAGLVALLGLFVVVLFSWLVTTHDTTRRSQKHAPESARISAPATGGARLADQSVSAHVPPPLYLTAAAVQKDRSAQFGAISGRVLSASTDQGVAKAELTFARGERTFSVVAGGNGDFLFSAPEAGHYVLAEVTAPDYFPFAPSWGASPIHIETRPGLRIDDVIVFLVPAIDYTGTVLSADHKAVSGATISILHDTDDEETAAAEGPRAPLVSDSQGRFHFHARDFDTIVATHPQLGAGRAVVDQPVQISHALTVILALSQESVPSAAHAVIAGKVVDQRGVPLAQVEVKAWLIGSPAEAAAGGRPRTKTNEHGEFVLATAAGQRYSVTAHAIGKALGRAENVASGTKDLILHLLDPVGKIDGTVRSGVDSGPVVAFTVLVSTRGPEGVESMVRETSFVDPDGRFTVDALAVGQYQVQAVASGYAPSKKKTVEVSADQAALVEITMPRGGCVGGRVVDTATRAPLTEARVSLESGLLSTASAMPTVASVSTTADGNFRLCGVGEGLRSVIVAAFGHDARIFSGVAIPADGEVGPLVVALDPVAEGEKPKTQLVGIGAQLSSTSDGLLIGKVLDGGGAAYVNLGPGDIIEKIDGQSTVGLDFQQAIEKIRGPADSVVELTVKKADGEIVDLMVPRRQLKF